jgi:hypothetical protein
MYRLVVALLLLLLISSQRVAGQVDSISYKLFYGKIIDDSMEYTLPSVHLWNESTRRGTISDDSGAFSIGVRNQDTIVFSAIGYDSYIMVVSSPLTKTEIIRLKPKIYEIDEVVVRRFSSFESFIYQVVHIDLPDTKTTEMREYIQATSTAAALEAERERVIDDKLETGRFGYISHLGGGLDPAKAFKEVTIRQKKKEQIINAKFNRELVGDITQLDGDELTEFIALCDFSDAYLYETDLYTIIEDLYAIFQDYQSMIDTVPSISEH